MPSDSAKNVLATPFCSLPFSPKNNHFPLPSVQRLRSDSYCTLHAKDRKGAGGDFALMALPLDHHSSEV